MTDRTTLRYLSIGHVCVDELADAPARIGGTVFFSSSQAATMGCAVDVVTACTEETADALRGVLPEGVSVAAIVADRDTRFGFGPDAEAGPNRLVSSAPTLAELPPGDDVDVIHLAPVFGELAPGLIDASPARAAFVGITPQGLMRGTGPDGKLTLDDDKWPANIGVAAAMVMSDVEFLHISQLGVLADYRGWVFRTRGPDAASLYRDGVEVSRRRPVTVVDVAPQRTIGAGDVFAAAAFVSLARGDDPDTALDVAVSSASTYVQRPDPTPTFVDGSGLTVSESIAG